MILPSVENMGKQETGKVKDIEHRTRWRKRSAVYVKIFFKVKLTTGVISGSHRTYSFLRLAYLNVTGDVMSDQCVTSKGKQRASLKSACFQDLKF